MKKLCIAAAIASMFCTGYVYAQEAPPADAPAADAAKPADAPVPDNAVSFNASVTSDYRYRGISQTHLDPAVQGGADYVNNPTGLYAGTWLSSIKWITDEGGSDDVEWDLYAGKRGDIIKDVLSYDVGVLSYVYPSNNLSPSTDTTEVYGQLSYGPAYIKYSYSLTDLFGFVNSKNSGYTDVGANFDVTNGFTINLHAGHQTVANNSAFSYTDWKVGVTKDFGVASLAAAVVGTNTSNYVSGSENLGKTALVVSLTKTF
jgi:uncharacterized protein (TIGR02001 family)